VQVNDDSALSHSAKDAVYKSYPDARRAHLKTGGNFPYLSRSNEVNLYIQVCCTLFLQLLLNCDYIFKNCRRNKDLCYVLEDVNGWQATPPRINSIELVKVRVSFRVRSGARFRVRIRVMARVRLALETS